VAGDRSRHGRTPAKPTRTDTRTASAGSTYLPIRVSLANGHLLDHDPLAKMDPIRHYPLAPFVNAFNSLAGRLLLVGLAFIAGTVFAGVPVFDAIVDAGWATVLFLPCQMLVSLFSLVGIITLPLILLYATVFVTSKCRLLWVWPLVGLIWLNLYAATHWAVVPTSGPLQGG